MDEPELVAARFEEHRPRLRAVACRIRGQVPVCSEAVCSRTCAGVR